TQKALAHRFSDKGILAVQMDADRLLLEAQPETNPNVPLALDNLAYLIYTSGSTGKPKAVMAHHHGLLNHACTMRDEYALQPGESILQYISISFDAAAEEISPALISGGTLVLPASAAELSGYDLLHILEQEKINILHVPVPVWHYFIDFLSEKNLPIPESIRLMLAGGEQPSLQKLHRAAQLAEHPIDFVNLYGPTETTIASTFQRVTLSDTLEFEYGLMPIGVPIQNNPVYLLDRELQPVPPGVFGEIYIGGFGVTRGYLNRPDLTAERFLPDPFSKNPGARMYRTGDLGRFNSNGEIIFSGRVDFQVKIRGFRIELGEIEAAIARFDGVKQNVVFAQTPETGGEKKLVAYVVPQDKENFSTDALRAYLSEQLPDYMVPSFFVTLDEIPLTPTGKVDRKALPDPTKGQAAVLSQNYVEPQSKLEKFLYEMWKDILGIERIGIHDNFFQLGGSSIQAATFVNRLQDALGEYVYIVAIYDAPTIADLVQLLKNDYPDGVYRITGERVEHHEKKER
ncbi:MAG TPA: amino acid adenylation domain-containing protein, partial [Caldithrix abyssi]|nr:amino acid adenylation domain-containing protein [Caldithrix abyssi]